MDRFFRDGDFEAMRKYTISCSFSLFCWWVMLRPRRPHPAVALEGLGQMTAARPCAPGAPEGVVNLHRIVNRRGAAYRLLGGHVGHQFEQFGNMPKNSLRGRGRPWRQA